MQPGFFPWFGKLFSVECGIEFASVSQIFFINIERFTEPSRHRIRTGATPTLIVTLPDFTQAEDAFVAALLRKESRGKIRGPLDSIGYLEKA
jgi:hypothetical protein